MCSGGVCSPEEGGRRAGGAVRAGVVPPPGAAGLLWCFVALSLGVLVATVRKETLGCVVGGWYERLWLVWCPLLWKWVGSRALQSARAGLVWVEGWGSLAAVVRCPWRGVEAAWAVLAVVVAGGGCLPAAEREGPWVWPCGPGPGERCGLSRVLGPPLSSTILLAGVAGGARIVRRLLSEGGVVQRRRWQFCGGCRGVGRSLPSNHW